MSWFGQEIEEFKRRWDELEAAFYSLKTLTKQYPAGEMSPEHRELAEAIHSMGREFFGVVQSDLFCQGCGHSQMYFDAHLQRCMAPEDGGRCRHQCLAFASVASEQDERRPRL